MKIPKIVLKIAFVHFVLIAVLTTTSVQAEDKTFADVCSECHTGGFKGWVSGAPNVKEKDEWKKFIERDFIPKMREIVLNGTDDHKKKGGCENCSNSDVIGAIDYMMSLVK